MEASPGKVVLLNGASSAGKSTLCRAIQARIDEPFLQFSPDFFMFSTEVLPRRWGEGGPFAWKAMRPQVFEGYYRSLTALAGAGNNLVLDIVLEEQGQLERMVEALRGLDVFYVGVHCPLEELIRREKQRGDRGSGDATRDFETVHTFSGYDLEVDSTRPSEANADLIIAAWKARKKPGIFDRLAGRVAPE